MSNEILKLKRGDVVEVIWVDACKIIGATFQFLSHGKAIEYKKHKGAFYILRKDKKYGVEYAIFIINNPYDAISIPLCCIVEVRKIE